ncbi:MAG: hypothetical protein L3J87_04710 [Thermoplasmata archaeon]|nr:hypothetical protein [Thermoplasmata archaeon]
MADPPTPDETSPHLPAGFRVERTRTPGRYPILSVFPGLGGLETARRLEPDSTARARLFAETLVEVVAEDMWMYVAPHDEPSIFRLRKAVVVPVKDCVVVGLSHLAESPALILFLDIFHELCHVRQRQAGRELWDQSVSYVTRPTEVEAYRFVVQEGRRLGVPDPVLREYLEVEWITAAEHEQLWLAVNQTGP